MPALIHCQQISKSFGVKQLFSNLTIGIEEKDRLGIVGPNGAGKSTLLKIMAGLETVDEGNLTRRQHLRVAYVPQEAEFTANATVTEVIEQAGVASGLPFEECVIRTQEVLGRTGFAHGGLLVGPLSGGWKKRLAIACGWVQSPDVMLLDEPTNHLDFDGLSWLESLMAQTSWPWVMVSHDRWLLDQAANKVAEINSRYPEGLFQIQGTYREFLAQREAYQESQMQQAQALAGKVRREEEWLRRGPKARTTKAKYRVDTAHALQAELAETKARLRQEHTDIDFVGSGRKTKQLVVAEHLDKAYKSNILFQDFELILSPGMAVGLLGHNGSGKSTLLKLLAKAIEPDRGRVTHADVLQLVYFDQHREQLDPKETLRKTLSDTGHTVMYRDRTVHLAAWAKRFRFQPEQLDLPIELLSGGEKARALIARLMLQPADVLIVDEPTNDLDIPTREVLEESLQEFPGALVLVTHDRYMLNRVCTQFVGLDGQGGHGLFAEYQQWERWLRRQMQSSEHSQEQSRSTNARSKRSQKKTFTYKERQEYDSLEDTILQAESSVEKYQAQLEDPAVVADHIRLQEAFDALQQAKHRVEQLYARWSELEAKLQGGQV
ncbi:ABC-F family ATP-binding cassette domain-containing protein [Candidatus Nitronereus thalassa]|uniref:ABC-F family ATP-binding cassette domain-containing protein n=1 Tax=Candidatus Nitronereus thalassa TaxID=3020898 RepID=A0ABU3K3H8_9BACT|nr:ABC-F family ATP-binding cassette domain-containing protein [Candidatus Nitronereus thalassa]MDT7040965.1 ABC-F family ATP-binding cassette domain-containing protein [Candidatus Nitronereus thalassa]